jgi:hypothetical protein
LAKAGSAASAMKTSASRRRGMASFLLQALGIPLPPPLGPSFDFSYLAC